MIKITHLNITDPRDSQEYERLSNDPNVEVITESQNTDKDGNAYRTLKYDLKVTKKKYELSSPQRI